VRRQRRSSTTLPQALTLPLARLVALSAALASRSPAAGGSNPRTQRATRRTLSVPPSSGCDAFHCPSSVTGATVVTPLAVGRPRGHLCLRRSVRNPQTGHSNSAPPSQRSRGSRTHREPRPGDTRSSIPRLYTCSAPCRRRVPRRTGSPDASPCRRGWLVLTDLCHLWRRSVSCEPGPAPCVNVDRGLNDCRRNHSTWRSTPCFGWGSGPRIRCSTD